MDNIEKTKLNQNNPFSDCFCYTSIKGNYICFSCQVKQMNYQTKKEEIKLEEK